MYQGNARTSVDVVEDFYGERLKVGLLRKIRSTPFYQLLELSDDLIAHGRRLKVALSTPTGSRQSGDALYDNYSTGSIALHAPRIGSPGWGRAQKVCHLEPLIG